MGNGYIETSLSITIKSIRQTERRELLLQIDRLIHVAPEDVPDESKFLLEVDFARLRQGDLTSQHYWVHAVKAAVVAGKRKANIFAAATPLYLSHNDSNDSLCSNRCGRSYGAPTGV
jgi:hypothetical protein